MCMWFSNFFENAFVSRVKRRICIRIVSFALAMKVDRYNATHPKEDPLQVPFNFEEDIEEMKIARGLDEDDESDPPGGARRLRPSYPSSISHWRPSGQSPNAALA